MKTSSLNRWSQTLIPGLAVAGLLWCPNAQAAIAMQDGSTNSSSIVENVYLVTNSVSTTFTVTAGASVLVVETFDMNNQTFDAPPTMSNWFSEPFQQCAGVAVPSGTGTGSFDIWYIYSPTPGTQTITATDTTGQVTNTLAIHAYTLSGVDTNNNNFPVFFSASHQYGGLSSVTLIPANEQIGDSPWVSGAWAAVCAGIGNNTIGSGNYETNTSGTPMLAQQPTPGVQSPKYGGYDLYMGGVASIAATASTITVGASSGVQTALGVAIFPPYVPATVPGTPANLVATGLTNAVALSWANTTAGGTTTSYLVSRSTTSGTGYAPIATNNGIANTNYTDSSVTDWVTYYYVVQAANASGDSPNSGEASAMAVGLPTAPTGLVGTWGINMATLNWNTQTGATNWNVLRSTTSGSGYTLVTSVSSNNYVDTGLANFTTYYYVVNATNSFGTGPNSAQVNVTPAVPITNYIGVFNSPADVVNWNLPGGNAGGTGSFYADAPTNGPSTGCLLYQVLCTNNMWGGVEDHSFPHYNETNATALEFDVKCEGPFDLNNQIQQFQPILISDADGYMQWGGPGLTSASTNSNNGWVHVVMPITASDGGSPVNWRGVTGLDLNVYDGIGYAPPTTMMIGYANLKFTGAPGYPPVFSGLANPASIATGTPSVTLTGTVSGGNGNYLFLGTLISVTINGNTQTTPVDDSTGDFTINFTGLASLSAASYPIAYASASDYQIFLAGTNNATSLVVGGGGGGPGPTILPVKVDATGRNLLISVATSNGNTYYLLTATSLNPPVVWTTNNTTAGTGGTITNSVPLNLAKDLYLKYQVQ